MSCQRATAAARKRRTPGQSGVTRRGGYLGSLAVETARAPASDDGSLTLNAPIQDDMANDNGPSIVATPYPTYISPGGDEDTGECYKAQLISHANASVERNQDSQFSAARDLQLAIRVVEGNKDGEIRALECRAALLEQVKDLDRRAAERDAAVKVELMAIRAEHAAAESARVARELAKVEADRRQDALNQTLAQIIARLPPLP